MIEALLSLLPEALQAVASIVAVAVAAVGLVLWVAGARFSRALMALAGVAAGVLLTVAWPKMARAATFSLLGATMLIGAGLPALEVLKPEWLQLLPPAPGARAGMAGGLAGVGTLIQWLLLPKARVSPPPSQRQRRSDADCYAEAGCEPEAGKRKAA